MRIYSKFPYITAYCDFIFTDILLMRHVPNADFYATFHIASVIKILIIKTFDLKKYVCEFSCYYARIFLFFIPFLPTIPPSLTAIFPFFHLTFVLE